MSRVGEVIVCVCVWSVLCFFSSGRRHTRFKCDWSSDVCSSDLHTHTHIQYTHTRTHSHIQRERDIQTSTHIYTVSYTHRNRPPDTYTWYPWSRRKFSLPPCPF